MRRARSARGGSWSPSRTLSAVAVAVGLVASACGGDDDASDAPSESPAEDSGTTGTSDGDATGGAVERGDTLTVATPTTPVLGLSASASEFGNRNLYYQAVYDGLLRAEPDGTIVPWLATEWSYNDDNTVLTMTLRDDVTFTDGDAVQRRGRRPEPDPLPRRRRHRTPATWH